MRRMLSISMMLVLAGLMAGCQNSNTAETPTTESESSTITAAVNTESETTAAEALGDKEIKIYLVRHGKTFFNTTGQVQGWVDSPLTDVGEKQADAVGLGLKDIPFAAAFSSDLGRQRLTAKRILAQNENPVPELLEEIGLREWFYGGYEGKTNAEMWVPIFEANGLQFDEDWSQYGELTEMLSDEDIANAIAANDEVGAAEDYEAILKRTQEAMDAIIKTAEAAGGGNVLAVSSGSEIPTILELVAPGQYQGESISNCSVTILTYQNGVYAVEVIGDKSYLEAGQK